MNNMYNIFKEIPEQGIRYLASPEKPYKWVKSADQAYAFSYPEDLAEKLNSEIVEIGDGWNSR